MNPKGRIAPSPCMVPLRHILAVCFAFVLSVPALAAEDRFAAGLYGELQPAGLNMVVSPASLADAFALVYPGAGGKTAAEMREVFGFKAPGEAPRFPPNLSADRITLRTANALWASRDAHLRPGYLAIVQRAYGAAVEPQDFRHHAAEARAHINQWAEERTAGRIRNLLSEDPAADTGVILTNAVYLKADWAQPFPAEATAEGRFKAVDGAKQATLMRKLGDFRHLRRAAFSAVELPYEDDRISMIVLLPSNERGLPRLEAAATPTALNSWLTELHAAHAAAVDVTLPKFMIESDIKLRPALESLGLRQAFSSAADFSAMAEAPLTISKVVQKAFIEVDERGTEAAAATATEVVITSSRVGPSPIPFRADHPFMFVIRDNDTGAILFLGRVGDPGRLP